jgi:site-specific DNA recombinase
MATKKAGTRAAVYIRVSSDQQEDNTSLETQEADALAFIAQQGMTHVATFRDVKSGYVLERPGLQAMLAAASAREFDHLVVYKVDRLSRNNQHFGYILVRLQQADIAFASVSEQDDSIGGQFLISVMALVGELYREQLIDRVTRAARARAESGRYMTGACPPFGYSWLKSAGEAVKSRRDAVVTGLEPDSINAPLLREIFQRIADGETATAIATSFNDRGIPTSRGGRRWWHQTIVAIVKNPVYKGEYEALRNMQVSGGKGKKSKTQLRPAHERTRVVRDIEPLVSSTLWQRANDQTKISRNTASRNNPEPEAYLLRAGILKCSGCGRALQGKVETGGIRRYRCKSPRSLCPSGSAIEVDTIDSAVWDMVTYVLKDRDWICQNVLGQESVPEHHLADLNRQMDQAARRIERTSTAIAMVDDPAPLVQQLNSLQSEMRSLQNQWDQVTRQRNQASKLNTMLNDFNPRVWEAMQAVDIMSYQKKRAMLRDFEVRVTLWPRDHEPRYTIDWAFDLEDQWWIPTDSGVNGSTILAAPVTVDAITHR